MLDEKKIGESSRIIRQLISDGTIIKSEPRRKSFFLEKSIVSVEIAKRLLIIQDKEQINTNM